MFSLTHSVDPIDQAVTLCRPTGQGPGTGRPASIGVEPLSEWPLLPRSFQKELDARSSDERTLPPSLPPSHLCFRFTLQYGRAATGFGLLSITSCSSAGLHSQHRSEAHAASSPCARHAVKLQIGGAACPCASADAFACDAAVGSVSWVICQRSETTVKVRSLFEVRPTPLAGSS